VSAVEGIHRGFVYNRRVEVLSSALADLLPRGATVLDVGCGDGLIDSLVLKKRPDVTIEGIDVLVRPRLHITVRQFDGAVIPHPDAAFDFVTFVDVLHHTDDPTVLLRQAARVARQGVIIKDHLLHGLAAGPTLRYMDRVGNESHGVRLPYNYWTHRQWLDGFRAAGLSVQSWTHRVPLYPWWASWVFGRKLHFVAKLSR
jgi:SAM-dependent methyltransferase